MYFLNGLLEKNTSNRLTLFTYLKTSENVLIYVVTYSKVHLCHFLNPYLAVPQKTTVFNPIVVSRNQKLERKVFKIKTITVFI